MHQIPQIEPWYDRKERQALSEYLKSGGWLTEFEKTKQLEKKIAAFSGSKYGLMTVNGTISLVLALLSLDLKPGDEVLVPNLTMIATPNSAVLLGLKPVLVDIEADTLCLDLKAAEKAVSSKTRGMLYVPFNGRSGRIKGGIDIHPVLGWNFKFTDLQAVIGLCQMEKLEWRVSRKKEIYDRLRRGLASLPQVLMLSTDLSDTVPWFMDIYVSDPDKLALFLLSKNIATRRIYPAVSSQKIYKEKQGKYPVSEKFAKKGLWLPSSARLSNKEIDYIVKQIRNYYS